MYKTLQHSRQLYNIVQHYTTIIKTFQQLNLSRKLFNNSIQQISKSCQNSPKLLYSPKLFETSLKTEHYKIISVTQLCTLFFNQTMHYTTLHNCTQLYKTLQNREKTSENVTQRLKTKNLTTQYNTLQKHIYTKLYNNIQNFTTFYNICKSIQLVQNSTFFCETLRNYTTTVHNDTKQYNNVQHFAKLYTSIQN